MLGSGTTQASGGANIEQAMIVANAESLPPDPPSTNLEGIHCVRQRKGNITSNLQYKPAKQQCSICLQENNPSQMKTFDTCRHRFCNICLNHHIILNLKQLRVIQCPEEGCPSTLTAQSPYIEELSKENKKSYKKILQIEYINKNPALRLCPNQDCQGVINIQEKQIQCQICQMVFCKCLIPKHEGECDERNIQFLQKQFKFKKCRACNIFTEKIKGCNHISCKCGHEFCYKCGEDWAKDPCTLWQRQRRARRENQNIFHRQFRRLKPMCQFWFCQCLKDCLLLILLGIPVDIILTSVFAVIFLASLPIIFIYSLFLGFKRMFDEFSVIMIAFLNIFLYIFSTFKCFCLVTKNVHEKYLRCQYVSTEMQSILKLSLQIMQYLSLKSRGIMLFQAGGLWLTLQSTIQAKIMIVCLLHLSYS